MSETEEFIHSLDSLAHAVQIKSVNRFGRMATIQDVKLILRGFLDTVHAELAAGREVKIPGLMKIQIQHQKERKRFNPHTKAVESFPATNKLKVTLMPEVEAVFKKEKEVKIRNQVRPKKVTQPLPISSVISGGDFVVV